MRVTAATPAMALAANAAGALIGCLYVPTLMTAVYGLAKRSPCPLRFQIAAQAGGGELTQVNPKIVEGVGLAMKVQTGGLGGTFVWPSLIRKLDKLDPTYKD